LRSEIQVFLPALGDGFKFKNHGQHGDTPVENSNPEVYRRVGRKRLNLAM
jgi:hypothetical protein